MGEGFTFFLRGISEFSGQAASTARRILELRERHRSLIASRLGRAAGNGHMVLERLFDRPIMSVADVQATTGTTYAAANYLVARLTESGVLEEITGYARHRRFRYRPYVQLFEDDVRDSVPE